MRKILALVFVLISSGSLPAEQATYSVLTIAGSDVSGSRDGIRAEAQFRDPAGVVGDYERLGANSISGNTYVSDRGNRTIRKISPTGVVTTFAGAVGQSGSADGRGSDARFVGPGAMALDHMSNLYVLDVSPETGVGVVRKITPAGDVTTIGGGASAGLVNPGGLAAVGSGFVYVANTGAHTIVRINTDNSVVVFAGSTGNAGAIDGIGSDARFNSPTGIIAQFCCGGHTLELRLWVTDTGNKTIRRISVNGQVTTTHGAPGQGGSTDGSGFAARFDRPTAIALSARLVGVEQFWVVDEPRTCVFLVCTDGPARVRSILGGVVTTVNGLTTEATATGRGLVGLYEVPPPSGRPEIGHGLLYVHSALNTVFSTMMPSWVLAGRGTGCTSAYPLDGSRLAARFCSIRSVAVTPVGVMYASDAGNSNIRRIALDGSVTTLAGGTRVSGSADGVGTAARFGNNSVYSRTGMGIDVDAAGNVWVADTANSTIRRISPDGTTVTVAGLAESRGTLDGNGSHARFNQPFDLAVDSVGNVFVADTGNASVRKVTPAGVVTTVAGLSGVGGSTDGTGAAARFVAPHAIAVGPGDALYIADTGNHVVRKITTDGEVTTIAGFAGSAGTVDGSGSVVRFNAPRSIAVDTAGQVFVGSHSDTVRRISPSGEVSTVTLPISCGSGCADGYGGVTDVDTAGTLYIPNAFTILAGTLAGETLAAPAITTHPSSQTITAGSPVTFTVAASGVPAPMYRWQMSSDSGTVWTNLSDAGPYSGTATSTLTLGTTRVSHPLIRFRAVATNAIGTATSNAATLSVPGLRVEPASLRFRVLKPEPTGPITSHPVQELLATFVATAPGPITWSADQPWVRLSPAPGGAPAVSVDIHDTGNVLGSNSAASAIITASAFGVSPAQIPVSLEIEAAGSAPPIGQVDTPTQFATGVQGAIVFSGWAIDDIGVSDVVVYRNCLAEEFQGNCQDGVIPGRPSDRVVSLGAAQMVAGARPDIDAAFPEYPGNRAGWGILILSNMLPRTTGTFSPYGGQGPVTLYAVAIDIEGQRTLLGRNWANDATPTTVTLNNDTIAKPFGTIDAPASGERVTSDIVANFGWVVTPDRDTVQGNADIHMANASGLTLFIDGIPTTAVTYNQCRGTVGNPVPPGAYCDDDVANIFGNLAVQAPLTSRTFNPTRFRNLDAGRGAMGSALIDASALANGLHTIAWSATDSDGRVEGIGARYISVMRPQIVPATDAAELEAARTALVAARATTGGVWARPGFDLSALFEEVAPGDDAVHRVRIAELGRVELWLGALVTSGALVAEGGAQSLPAGSSLDPATGHFTWMPGPGFLGVYRLAFQRGEARVDVEVTIDPARSVSATESEIHMDTLTVSGALTLKGRAVDPRAFIGHGIGAVHVWGLRQDQAGAVPVFLGTAEMATDGTYTFSASSLERGMWDVTAYVWNIRTTRFEDARTVRVTVR